MVFHCRVFPSSTEEKLDKAKIVIYIKRKNALKKKKYLISADFARANGHKQKL